MANATSSPTRTKRPFRMLQIAMLSGCLMLLAVWVFTSFYIVMFATSSRTLVHLRDGGVWFTSDPIEAGMSKINTGTHLVRHTSDRVFPGPGPEGHWTVIPFWLPLTVLACALALIFVWTMPVGKPGRCRRCGYDLRGSPEKCPECGCPAETQSRS